MALQRHNGMAEHTNVAGKSELASEKDEVKVIDIAIVAARHKRLLLLLPLGVGLVAAAISLALPNVYSATAKLLPPQQNQSSAAALLSQIGGMAGSAASAAGIKSPSDLYVGLLKSRTVADRLVDQYGLKKLYDTPSQEAARTQLQEGTDISAGKDGFITIRFESKDQQLVARVANSYVEELVRLTRVLAVTESSQRRMFFERQLERAKNNLAAAEIALKGALDTRGVISVDSESRAVMETVARLRAQASAKEIQLNSMRAFLTPSNPEFRRVEEELSSLRTQVSKLENGRADASSAEDQSASKQVGVENIKLLRDVKYYQMLYELLAKQYEVARLDEAKDPAMIQVLDAAMVPERKSSPRRAVIVLLSIIASFVAAVVWIFLADARRKAMASADGAARWAELKLHLGLK
jgi:tyrosine-protein kinase Etk/Wzc